MVKGLSKFKKNPLGVNATNQPSTPQMALSKGKKHLDLERVRTATMSQHGSSTCNSQFESDEYNYEDHKMNFGDVN